MPYQRPSLPQLIDEGAGEFESRLPGVLARARRSIIGVLNRVLAGALDALYKYAEHIDRQKWPDLADNDHLDDHGARWNKPRLPAAPASGAVRFTGVDGAVISAGTVVQRADGRQYQTTAEGLIAGGEAVVPVLALEAGQNSNAVVATTVTLTSPVGGVTATAVTTTALSGGADVEGEEAYRARILARIRKAPHGGREADYIEWATNIPGVTRAWVYPNEQGAGSVVVRFVRDDDVAGLIPDAGEVAAVQAHIDTQRPVTAAVTVVAPIADPLDFTIALTPNTASVRAAVEAELEDLIQREAIPGGTLLLTHLREAVSAAAGETDHNMTVPSANVVSPTGHVATMGVITWA